MPPAAPSGAKSFKMTAQMYSECWRERIEKEQAALAAVTLADLRPEPAPPPAAPPSAASSKGGGSVISGMSMPSAISNISSRVSTSSATARKVELLQQKLEAERKRTFQLEQALKAAKTQGK